VKLKGIKLRLIRWLPLSAAASIACVLPAARGAGVTVITHGFNGDAQGWVLGMAGNIPGYYRFPGTNVICYEVRVQNS